MATAGPSGALVTQITAASIETHVDTPAAGQGVSCGSRESEVCGTDPHYAEYHPP